MKRKRKIVPTQIGNLSDGCSKLKETVPLDRRSNLQIGTQPIVQLVELGNSFTPFKSSQRRFIASTRNNHQRLCCTAHYSLGLTLNPKIIFQDLFSYISVRSFHK